MLSNTCIERDLLDTREVSANAYYGVHTLRAIENFYISNNKISDIPESVRGMVVAKEAATMTNKELQIIPRSVANAIIAACDEVLNNEKCMNQFSVDVYQDGAGISINMNTNEALASTGLELTGHQKGGYQYLNPNDHISKCQLTNDAYPTGFRTAVYASIIKLVDVLNQLHEDFEKKVVELQDALKMSRTQLQDAVSMTLGQEFHTSNALLKGKVKSISRTTEPLLKVNLGAIAIGTGLDTSKEYSPLAVQKLAEVTGSIRVPAEDLTEATSDCDAYVMVHGALKRLVVKMSKIYNDLCSLSSGPCVGLNEISLSELQAGSSIIPAKANPVVPEVVNQVCFKVIGNDITVTMASEAGQLQLNVTESVIDQAMLESVRTPSNACYNLLGKCISGITANKEVCEVFVFNSIGIVTYLNPFIGHHNGDTVGKTCAGTGRSAREVVLECGLLTESELDDIFSVQNLMHPAYKVKRHTDESEQ